MTTILLTNYMKKAKALRWEFVLLNEKLKQIQPPRPSDWSCPVASQMGAAWGPAGCLLLLLRYTLLTLISFLLKFTSPLSFPSSSQNIYNLRPEKIYLLCETITDHPKYQQSLLTMKSHSTYSLYLTSYFCYILFYNCFTVISDDIFLSPARWWVPWV